MVRVDDVQFPIGDNASVFEKKIYGTLVTVRALESYTETRLRAEIDRFRLKSDCHKPTTKRPNRSLMNRIKSIYLDAITINPSSTHALPKVRSTGPKKQGKFQ